MTLKITLFFELYTNYKKKVLLFFPWYIQRRITPPKIKKQDKNAIETLLTEDEKFWADLYTKIENDPEHQSSFLFLKKIREIKKIKTYWLQRWL